MAFQPRKLWVGNLPQGSTAGDLRAAIGRSGAPDPTDIVVRHSPPPCDVFAFVEFASDEDVQRTIVMKQLITIERLQFYSCVHVQNNC